jgi:hypothetical protein
MSSGDAIRKEESRLTTIDRSFARFVYFSICPFVHLSVWPCGRGHGGLHVICMVPGGLRWSLESSSEGRYQSEGDNLTRIPVNQR